MSQWCPSCGGILGRECFNPDECAWITMSMQHQAQQDAIQREVARQVAAALAAGQAANEEAER